MGELNELLNIQPTELKFPFELKKQISTSMRLVNTTSEYVAFKVKTTSPKKYCVRPNTGFVPPQSSAEVTIMMQAQKETPPDLVCKDKFLVQSVAVPGGQDPKELNQELFTKESGRKVFEAKLRVVYVPPPQPPSPVAESPDEGLPSPADREYQPATQEYPPFEKPKPSAPALPPAVTPPQQIKQQLTKPVPRGWSLLHILIVAVIAFAVGYFYGLSPAPAPATS